MNPDVIPVGIAVPLIVVLWGWLILRAIWWLREPARPTAECLACGKRSGPLADLAQAGEWIEAHRADDHPDRGTAVVKFEGFDFR